ncbi:MAG: hypothetical protein LBD14_04650 [Puniceicoccales bacterium]|nr:hypothetical protein [Puniceicoccales bacterium]
MDPRDLINPIPRKAAKAQSGRNPTERRLEAPHSTANNHCPSNRNPVMNASTSRPRLFARDSQLCDKFNGKYSGETTTNPSFPLPSIDKTGNDPSFPHSNGDKTGNDPAFPPPNGNESSGKPFFLPSNGDKTSNGTPFPPSYGNVHSNEFRKPLAPKEQVIPKTKTNLLAASKSEKYFDATCSLRASSKKF